MQDVARLVPGLRPKPLGWLVPAVVAGSITPFVVIAGRAFTGRLGANPIATAMNQLGLLALLFLLLSLACTPLKILFGVNWPLRLRRTLGLFAFGAAATHFLVYVVLDQVLTLRAIWIDVAKRPFITVGFAAFVLLTPLALTSSKEMLQRLGFRRWKLLHRLAYVIAGLGIIHFLLRVKASLVEPLTYGAVLVVLLGVRGVSWASKRRR